MYFIVTEIYRRNTLNTFPTIAVLIPAYNEEVVIEGTIDSLIRAGCAKSDIYIVDDRSTDNTAALASATGVNVYTVPENGGKANAQKAALAYFQLLKRYDWIIFFDGDTKVDPLFMMKMRGAAENDPDVGLYLGQVKSTENDHLYSAMRSYDYTYGQDIAKQGQSNFNVVFVGPGCASMYNSQVLEKLDIDPSTLAEDMDLTMQVHRIGKKVQYVDDAIVFTQDPSTFVDYKKQMTRWYRGFWQVIKKHKVFGWSKKQRVDWYLILLTLDAVIFNRLFWLTLIAILYTPLLFGIMAIDYSVSLLIAAYCSWRTGRLDTLYKHPIYYWLSFYNFYAFMKSFVEIIVQRKEILAWNKVRRYSF